MTFRPFRPIQEREHVPVGHEEELEDDPLTLTANAERIFSVLFEPHFSHT
jgi:hypothetical protein